MRKKVELGDEVKDSVSGFKGIAVSTHVYLHGCTRISVQPKVDKTGKHPETQAFDEPQLIILKKGKIKTGGNVLGGCNKYMDKGK